MSEVTLKHLLTMSDGISSSGNMIGYFFQDETQSKSLKRDPGAEFHFNGMSPQILSMIISKTTMMNALDFGKKYLFGPFGINDVVWAEQYGYSRGLWGILLTSRDMAKFGLLYLKSGAWDQDRILPAEWIAESTRPYIATGNSSNYWKNYGFNWWVCRFGNHQGYYAFGLAGQSICIVPDLDLVAVVTFSETAANKPNWDIMDGILEKYLEFADKHLIAAVLK
jgi:CubicO group peptidase (beta-lactamase class C family)